MPKYLSEKPDCNSRAFFVLSIYNGSNTHKDKGAKIIFRSSRHILIYLGLIIIISCSGCSLINGYYADKARDIAVSEHWLKHEISSHGFQLTSFSKPSIQKSSIVSIYIEGDGFAWKNRWTPSHDPTPKDPLTLRLAIQDPWPLTVYLGRPCQFLTDINKYPACTVKNWTSHRYSDEIITAMNDAISQIKKNFKVEQVGLTGYSGGGTVAALIAERRNDIAWLITIAANLDHKAWTDLQGVTPLFGSLNPADDLEKLAHIPQVHLVGIDDKIVPSKLVKSFVDREGTNTLVKFIEIDNTNHYCCWPEIWPDILKRSELKLIRRNNP